MKIDRTKRQIELRLETIEYYNKEISDFESEILYSKKCLIKELNETDNPRIITDTIVVFHDKINDWNRMIDHKKKYIMYEYERIMEILSEDERTEEIFKTLEEKE